MWAPWQKRYVASGDRSSFLKIYVSDFGFGGKFSFDEFFIPYFRATIYCSAFRTWVSVGVGGLVLKVLMPWLGFRGD